MGNETEQNMKIFKEMLEMQNKAYRAMTQVFMDDMKSEIREIRKDLEDVKMSVAFISKDNDSLKVEMKSVDLQIKNLSNKIEHVEGVTIDSFEDMADHVDYLENQSRRNNIKLLGVPEDSNEKSWDDTEDKVKSLIKMHLKVSDEVDIERAHRVGKFQKEGRRDSNGKHQPPKPRAIVAKFKSWKVKEQILKKAREVRPTSLMFVNDFSQRTLEKRRALIPELEKARKNNKQAFLVMDRLVVRDKPPDARPRMRNNKSYSHAAANKDSINTSKDDEIEINI